MSEPQPGSDARGSLAGRLVAGARAWWASRPELPARRRDWWVGGGIAALIAAGPLATIIGGNWLAGGVRAEVVKLEAEAAPRLAAEKAAARDRAELMALLRRPGLGATAEALARALPAEAALLRMERNRDGLLEIEVSAPDPDRLRAALRREPMLARLRDAGQRRGDMMMTVSFSERPE